MCVVVTEGRWQLDTEKKVHALLQIAEYLFVLNCDHNTMRMYDATRNFTFVCNLFLRGLRAYGLTSYQNMLLVGVHLPSQVRVLTFDMTSPIPLVDSEWDLADAKIDCSRNFSSRGLNDIHCDNDVVCVIEDLTVQPGGSIRIYDASMLSEGKSGGQQRLLKLTQRAQFYTCPMYSCTMTAPVGQSPIVFYMTHATSCVWSFDTGNSNCCRLAQVSCGPGTFAHQNGKLFTPRNVNAHTAVSVIDVASGDVRNFSSPELPASLPASAITLSEDGVWLLYTVGNFLHITPSDSSKN